MVLLAKDFAIHCYPDEKRSPCLVHSYHSFVSLFVIGVILGTSVLCCYLRLVILWDMTLDLSILNLATRRNQETQLQERPNVTRIEES